MYPSTESQTMYPLTIVLLAVILIWAITITVLYTLQSPGSHQEFTRKTAAHITYKELGQNGRLGNQLFQIATTLSLAEHLRKNATFPPWKYQSMFPGITEFIGKGASSLSTQEVPHETDAFTFDPELVRSCNKPENLNVNGFRQHLSYFNNISWDIRKVFTISPNLITAVKHAWPILQDTCIALHVRRGDYISEQFRDLYDICTKEYFNDGITFFLKQCPTANLVVITDDKPWCTSQFPKAHISPFNSEQEDFVALHLCRFKIISNSTFAWWAAWLDARFTSRVIAPSPWIRHPEWMESSREIYPRDWIIYDVPQRKSYNLVGGEDNLMPIGAYYQCYKQPKAFYNVCQAWRRVYPDVSLIIVSDNGTDFSKEALTEFRALSYTTNSKRSGNGHTTVLQLLESGLVFMKNFIQAAQKISEDWFVLLEDDVYVDHHIRIPDTTCDIIGNNSHLARFTTPTMRLFKDADKTPKSSYYGGCGGSLFRTQFWRNLKWDIVEEQLQEFGKVNKVFHSDMMLSYICLMNDGHISCGQSSSPLDFSETRPVFGQDYMPSILHQFKDWYV